MQRMHRLRKTLLKGHRRVGVLVALFACYLAVTGVMINHCNALGWDRQRLASVFWLQLYGVSLQRVEQGYPVQDHWLTEAGGRLFFDAQVVSDCGAPLKGVVIADDSIVALCADALVLLTPAGELIERIVQAASGKQGLGLVSGKIVSREGSGLLALNRLDATWAPVLSPAFFSSAAIQWSEPAALPLSVSTALQWESVPGDLTWERLLLDLHSGRLFGNLGVFAVDVMALLIVLLALTGLWGVLARKR